MANGQEIWNEKFSKFLDDEPFLINHSRMTSLSTFIAHARDKGMDHQTIRMLLLSAGWKEKDISGAMASEGLGMAVPLPPDSGSARDAFFHLLGFTSLLSTVGSLIFLFFQYWNRLFEDAAFRDSSYSTYDNFGSIRWGIATLFIAYPLYVWMSRLLHREMSRHHEKQASGVRRWLTYLTLFFTACVLVGDLVTVVFYLLQGEITVRFLVKALTLFIICGSVFSYYFYALRMAAEEYGRSALHFAFLAFSGFLVALAIVWGFLIAGGPMYGRQQRLDDQRMQDLRTIQNEIYNIAWGSMDRWSPSAPKPENPLPKTLNDVAANVTYQKISTVDPETQAPYVYTIVDATKFKLCATFSLPRDMEYDVFWNHPAGEKCFEFDLLDRNTR